MSAFGVVQEARRAIDETSAESSAIVLERPAAGIALLRLASQPLGVLRLGVKVALIEALGELELDESIKCLVVTGTGRAFSVGSDIREFSQTIEHQRRMALIDQALNDRIEFSRLPVIAACNGFTLGGGAELALACDIRLAAGSAVFGFPEVQVGSIASAGGTQRLPRLVGRGRASVMLLTGQTISAAEALEYGLVDQVAEGDSPVGDAISLAGQIAANPAFAVSASKRCVISGDREGHARGFRMERELGVAVGIGTNAAIAQDAFLKKTVPQFANDISEWLSWEQSQNE